MSLIHDALQRAKDNQPENPPAAGPPLAFRPIENNPRTTEQFKSMGAGLMFFVLLLVCVGLALVFLVEIDKTLKVKAASASVGKFKHSESGAASAQAATQASAPADTAASSGSRGDSKLSGGMTNATASAVALLPPKPAPPRLQALFFTRTKPSAIISGNTVYVGSRVGEFRVETIGLNRVVLVSGIHTNVLTLE